MAPVELLDFAAPTFSLLQHGLHTKFFLSSVLQVCHVFCQSSEPSLTSPGLLAGYIEAQL